MIDFISIAFPVEMCNGKERKYSSGEIRRRDPAHGVGTGVCAARRRGKAPPIFFGLAKENGPRPVQKKNAFVSKSCPLGRFGQERGSGETVLPPAGSLLPGALYSRGTEIVLPRIWGLGAAFGVVDVWPLILFPRSSLRLALPGRQGENRFEVYGATAAGKRRSNRFCGPVTQFPAAG